MPYIVVHTPWGGDKTFEADGYSVEDGFLDVQRDKGPTRT